MREQFPVTKLVQGLSQIKFIWSEKIINFYLENKYVALNYQNMSSAMMFGLQRIQGVSTNNFLIPPNGSDNASASGIVTFHLPSAAIIDRQLE